MAGLILLSGAFTSCEKIAEELENATEITINTTLDAPIVAVPEASKAGEARFNESYVLDIANNADLGDYIEKIKSLELKQITVTVESSTPSNLTLLNGTFSITDNVDGTSFSFAAPNNMPLLNGSSFTIDETNPGWATVNAIIASKHAATVRANGVISNETFEVTFLCSLGVKATVEQ